MRLKFHSSRDVLYNCLVLSKSPEYDPLASMFVMRPSIITIYRTVGGECWSAMHNPELSEW